MICVNTNPAKLCQAMPSCTRIPGFATHSATASPLRQNSRTSSLQVFLENKHGYTSMATKCIHFGRAF